MKNKPLFGRKFETCARNYNKFGTCLQRVRGNFRINDKLHEIIISSVLLLFREKVLLLCAIINREMNELTPQLEAKLKNIEDWFSERNGSIVAFSGGIDSSLVLFLARKVQGREKAIGVISRSESLKTKDFELAEQFCQDLDIQLEVIYTQELSDERYSANPENRCFICKEYLYHSLRTISQKYPSFDIISGTNYNDLGDYRPGLQSAANHNIQAPLVQCQVTKEDIRQLALYFGLPNWNKPASPCLSSRIPYNQTITLEKLQQVEKAESLLNDLGFIDVRVRHYGNYAKVEVPAEELGKLQPISDLIISKIKALGFEDVHIDQEGLVSGKLNRSIINK